MKVLLIARTMAFGGGAESLVYNIYLSLKRSLGPENAMLIVFQHSSIFNFENIDQYEKEFKDDKNFVISDAYVQLSLLKKNLISVESLSNKIQLFKPDIIHSHLFLSELYSRSVFYSPAKWFSHFHDNMVQFENFNLNTFFNKTKLTNYFEKLFLFKKYKNNGGNHFIAISDDTFKYAKKTVGDYPVTLLNNAIDCSKFKRKESIKKDKIRIINIGNFTINKNQSLFIEIAISLLKHTSNFEIVLIGYGPLMNELIEKVKIKGISDHFIFLGAVTNVEEYLENSNLYVHTAFSEAFGLVLIEAMTAGLPVIALDAKGNRDIIENGKNGFLINKPDADFFTFYILELMKDPVKFNSISEYATIFAQKYDINKYMEKLLNLYKSA